MKKWRTRGKENVKTETSTRPAANPTRPGKKVRVWQGRNNKGIIQIKKHNIGFYLYSLTLFIKYIHIVLKNKVPSLYLVLPLLHGAVGRIKIEDRTSVNTTSTIKGSGPNNWPKKPLLIKQTVNLARCRTQHRMRK